MARGARAALRGVPRCAGNRVLRGQQSVALHCAQRTYGGAHARGALDGRSVVVGSVRAVRVARSSARGPQGACAVNAPVVVCDWFAACTRPATGVVAHPVLGYVPTCGECARSLDLTLIGGTFSFEGDEVVFTSALAARFGA
jgi:hypothetical protein